MTSHSPLEATSSSLLPSPASLDIGGHALWLPGQMRNPLAKTRALEAASTLVTGDDGALELAVGAIELGLVGQDAFVKRPESHNIGFEPPVVGGLDGVEEGSVSGGGPLKGFVDPMGQWLRRVSCIFGGCIDLAHVREVVRAVLSGIPRHSTIIELLDPLGRVGEPSSDRDSKRWETAVFDISGRRLGEGVDVADEAGFEEFDCLLTVIQLLLVVHFLGGEVVAGDGGAD